MKSGGMRKPFLASAIIFAIALSLIISIIAVHHSRTVAAESGDRSEVAPKATAPGVCKPSLKGDSQSRAKETAGGDFANSDGLEGERSRRELFDLLTWWGAAVADDVPADEQRVQRLVKLINALGKGALYDIINQGNESKVKWAAFSALCSMLSVGDGPLKSLGAYGFVETHDERFLATAQEFALNSTFEPRLRRLAIQAVWSFPLERAASVFLALLGQGGIEADVFTVINSYTKTLPESVRSQAVRKAVEVLSNPSADDEARSAAVGLLRGFPETIVSLVGALSQETSVDVRRGIAHEGSRLVAEIPGDPKADSIIGPLLQIASSDADPGTRCNILFRIGTEGVRKHYGDAVGKALLSISTGSNPDSVRAAAVRALGDGGYVTAAERIRELISDSSPDVAKSAEQALSKLKP